MSHPPVIINNSTTLNKDRMNLHIAKTKQMQIKKNQKCKKIKQHHLHETIVECASSSNTQLPYLIPYLLFLLIYVIVITMISLLVSRPQRAVNPQYLLVSGRVFRSSCRLYTNVANPHQGIPSIHDSPLYSHKNALSPLPPHSLPTPSLTPSPHSIPSLPPTFPPLTPPLFPSSSLPLSLLPLQNPSPNS
jgi:hypothetical protein